jgi:hypothetical protein
MVDQLASDQAVTGAPGFDYGASGRGGWDEAAAGVVSVRKRVKKNSVRRDASVYLSRAEMQGRCPVDLRKMTERDLGGGVYIMANVASRDFYIGSSGDLVRRWRMHVSGMRRRCHEIPTVNTLVRKYGIGSFRFLLIQSCDSARSSMSSRQREEVERRWIEHLRPTLNRPGPNGFPRCGTALWQRRAARSFGRSSIGRVSKTRSPTPTHALRRCWLSRTCSGARSMIC